MREKRTKRKPTGPWLSVPQYAEKFGYSESTVRRWLGLLERDTRITLEQRLAIMQGPHRSRRIHEQRFAVWLSTLPQSAQAKPASVVFVYTTPAYQ